MARTRVLSNRIAYDCIAQMVYQWCADMCASVGDPAGIGSVEYGKAIVSNNGVQWPAWTTSIADWIAVGTENEPPLVPIQSGRAVIDADTVEGGLATSGLITITDAMDIAREELNLLFTQYTAKMFPQRAGTYRKFCHWSRGKARMEVYYQECCAKMKAACYSQSKRNRGLQVVSTRRTDFVANAAGTFSGKYCFRAARGRPALPASVWLKRYRARKRKERKTKRTRKDNRPAKQVPSTKVQRPPFVLNLKRKGLRKTIFTPSEPDNSLVPDLALSDVQLENSQNTEA